MKINAEFEIVKDCAWYLLRRVGSKVVLFRSLTRANVTDHFVSTYEEETE